MQNHAIELQIDRLVQDLDCFVRQLELNRVCGAYRTTDQTQSAEQLARRTTSLAKYLRRQRNSLIGSATLRPKTLSRYDRQRLEQARTDRVSTIEVFERRLNNVVYILLDVMRRADHQDPHGLSGPQVRMKALKQLKKVVDFHKELIEGVERTVNMPIPKIAGQQSMVCTGTETQVMVEARLTIANAKVQLARSQALDIAQMLLVAAMAIHIFVDRKRSSSS